MQQTESILASRSTWIIVAELSRHTDTMLGEKIAALELSVTDFETHLFLVMRRKIILAILRGYDQEITEQMELEHGKANEAEVEVDITLSEAQYLDMSVGLSDFPGALSFKVTLWRIIAALTTRKEEGE